MKNWILPALCLTLASAPSVRADAIPESAAFTAIFARLGTVQMEYLKYPTGKTSSGKVCQLLLNTNPSQPSFSIEVDLPTLVDGKDTGDQIPADLDLFSGPAYAVQSLDNSGSSLEMKFSLHTPAGKTDWGWPFPAHTTNSSFKLNFNASGAVVSAEAVEDEGFLGIGRRASDCTLDQPYAVSPAPTTPAQAAATPGAPLSMAHAATVPTPAAPCAAQAKRAVAAIYAITTPPGPRGYLITDPTKESAGANGSIVYGVLATTRLQDGTPNDGHSSYDVTVNPDNGCEPTDVKLVDEN